VTTSGPGNAVDQWPGGLERIQVGRADWQAAGSYVALDRKGFRTVGANSETVAELRTDEAPGHLVEKQRSAPDFHLLVSRQGRHHETVTDVDVELIS
jgi:hypothetical protein